MSEEQREKGENVQEPQSVNEIKMICPICNHAVVKVRETDVHIKHNVVHENDFYQHYIDSHGHDKLIRFKNPPEQTFPDDKLNYAPLKIDKPIFFS